VVLEGVPNRCKMYYTQDGACKWGDFAWLGRELYMQQGKVTAVSKIIHYD
jgi:hypothetical protein